MAAVTVRVFGTPITQGTRTQRAQAAAKYQNADVNLDQLFQQVSQNAAAAGPLSSVPITVTRGVVFNATGDPITYVTEHNWEGRVVARFPVHIENGQYAIFSHLGAGNFGSVAAVVYYIQNCCDSLIAWNNPLKEAGHVGNSSNSAYCEMNKPGYYNNNCDWNAIYEKLKSSGTDKEANMSGYKTRVIIDDDGKTPWFHAFLSLNSE